MGPAETTRANPVHTIMKPSLPYTKLTSNFSSLTHNITVLLLPNHTEANWMEKVGTLPL